MDSIIHSPDVFLQDFDSSKQPTAMDLLVSFMAFPLLQFIRPLADHFSGAGQLFGSYCATRIRRST